MKHSFLFLALLLPFLTVAQSNKVSKHNAAKYFVPEQAFSPQDFVNSYFDDLGLNNPKDLIEARRYESKNGWIRNRYKQSYKGLDVLGSSLILHEKNGKVKKFTGNVFPDINLSTKASQSKSEIEDQLMNHIWNDASKSTADLIAIKEDFKIESIELKVGDRIFPKFSGDYRLVYEVIAKRSIPEYDRISYFMDAHTGELLNELSHLCSVSVEGQANTRYYGTKKIITDSIAPNKFVLFDETRDIRTLNGEEQGWFPSRDDYVDFEDENNYWNNVNEKLDEVAGDVHYCSAAYHDFMLDNFDWKGLDGTGSDSSGLISVVHINDKYYLNAFWDGQRTYYGNGLCVDYGPLTTLDVVAHEFAHAFTQFSSGLIYRDESGALNEGTSDIFGKAVEYAYDPDNFNWLIGDRFTNSEGEAFRNMSDPNDKNHPKYYQGLNWSSFGAVHTNSGVYNFWYYLLVEGGSGVNEGGYAYNVPKIGWEDATDIVFGAQVGYYTPSTTYNEAYKFTLEYIKDAYGPNSQQYEAVEEAWRAVGVTGGESGLSVGGTLQVEGIATTICTDECLDVTLDLVNLGNTTIEAGARIDLRYLLDSDIMTEEILILDEDLEVGEGIEFTFERQVCWFDIGGGQDYLQIEISTDNGDNYASLDYDFINLNDGAALDVELTRFELTNNVCNSEFFSLQYRFENIGCEIIPAGTSYNIVVTVDGNEQVVQRTLNYDVRPSVGQIVITSLFFDIPISFNNDYTVQLVFDDDPNFNNNDLSGSFQTFQIMQENQVEDFSNYSTDLSKWVYSEEAFYLFSNAINHQSSERLLVGSSSAHFEFNEPRKCVTAEDFFQSVAFVYKSNLNVCYDAAGMQDPVLRFEYIPYYSSEIPGLTEEFTSIHQVFYPNYDERLPIQQGFSEGVERTLTYDVPYDSGELTIEVLCMYGDEFDVLNGDLSNGDYQLFDNIRIEERGSVSTEDDLLAQDITVYPNPANAHINFADEKQRDFKLSILSIDGKQIYQQNVSQGKFTWFPDQHLTGLFFYKMEFDNGRITNGKFVLEN